VEGTAEAGATRAVDIVVDVGQGGQGLGSYGGSLSWDASVLRFLSFTGGDPPFDAPVVNTEDVLDGLLAYADASPVGAHGRLRLLTVVFEALAEPPASSELDLDFGSLFGAGDFQDLVPLLEVEDGTVCVADFPFALRVRDPVNTTVDWTAIPQAASYDVVRGDLHALWTDGGVVHLGDVICLEDDSLDTTTGAGAEPANPDTEVPAPGTGFFYLIRFHDGVNNRTYGYFRDCVRERIVDGGDCP